MQSKDELRVKAAEALSSIGDTARGLSRTQVITVISLLVLLVLGGYAAYSQSKPTAISVVESRGPKKGNQSPRMLTVHVAGAVNSPGLYRLPEGSRVDDALGKAAGPAEDAVLDNLNLAARLKDGEKVMVPRLVAAEEASTATSTGGEGASAPVNINTAGREKLEELPGVGPSLADRIIRYREKDGQFATVDELDNVEGIGPRKMESLKDLVTI
jgi:competence protein ComEA